MARSRYAEPVATRSGDRQFRPQLPSSGGCAPGPGGFQPKHFLLSSDSLIAPPISSLRPLKPQTFNPSVLRSRAAEGGQRFIIYENKILPSQKGVDLE